MTTLYARRLAALLSVAGIAFAAPAYAQDKTAKIGVLTDMSSLYADIGGPGAVTAIKLAIDDSGLRAKGWKIDVVSGDHQNKPDVGVNIARHGSTPRRSMSFPIRRTPASRSLSATSSRKRTRSCSTRARPAPT